jgi:FAD/FMN-containing dehydrogenase
LEADCTYVAVVGRGVLKGPFTLLVGIAGTEGHMAALSQRVRALVAADGPDEDAGPTRSQAEADRARGILHGIDVGAAIRVALPPSEASRAIPKLAPDDEEWTWLAPCGVLAAGTPSGSPERDRSFVERLVAEWPASKSRLWLRLPDSHYGSVPVFGGYGPALPLIRAIKAAFDPAGSFSPGRLAGAI